jgi:hypothetical protein
MKSSFIAASVIALGAFAHAEDAQETHRIEVSVQVATTRITARNHGVDQQILLFRSSERGPVIARSLPPAGELVYDFPRHALFGVEIEIVSVHGHHISNTGAGPVGEAFAGDHGTVWLQRTPDGPFVWLERNGSFTPHRPDSTLLPRSVLERGPELIDFSTNATNNAHVPVVTPRDKPDEYGPPELEETPLPPV